MVVEGSGRSGRAYEADKEEGCHGKEPTRTSLGEMSAPGRLWIVDEGIVAMIDETHDGGGWFVAEFRYFPT